MQGLVHHHAGQDAVENAQGAAKKKNEIFEIFLNSEKNGRFSQGDRFIPNRSSLNIDVAHLALMAADGTASSDPTACLGSPEAGETSSSDHSGSDAEYKSQLSSTLLNGASADDRILAFKHKAPLPAEGTRTTFACCTARTASLTAVRSARRWRDTSRRRPSAFSTRPSCSTTTT
jgi:hypothetical protein